MPTLNICRLRAQQQILLPFFFFLLLWFSLELVYMLDAACYVKCGVVQQKCESEYLSEGAFMKDVLQKS